MVAQLLMSRPHLIMSRVDAGGVMGTGVKDDDGALWSGLQIFEHSVDVETPGLLVPVAVLLHLLEAAVLEDHAMVAPGKTKLLNMIECLSEHNWSYGPIV